MMIEISPHIAIGDDEIRLEFVRASGPGGQHVNKVATAVQLRFDIRNSPSISDDVRQRLLKLAGRRVTDEGILIIKAQRFRSQEKNRRDALDRLVRMIRNATHRPRLRRKTKPSKAAKEKRLSAKHHRSRVKKLRRRLKDENE